jgi:hypothetical protein
MAFCGLCGTKVDGPSCRACGSPVGQIVPPPPAPVDPTLTYPPVDPTLSYPPRIDLTKTYPTQPYPPQANSASPLLTAQPPAKSRAPLVVGIISGVVCLAVLVAIGIQYLTSLGATSRIAQPAAVPTVTLTRQVAVPGQAGSTTQINPAASTHTDSPAAPPPQASPTLSTTQVVVARTCGSDGTSDCVLYERDVASRSGAILRPFSEGSALRVSCQVVGETVRSSVLNRSSAIWSRTPEGGYVSNIYLDGVDQFQVTRPCP